MATARGLPFHNGVHDRTGAAQQSPTDRSSAHCLASIGLQARQHGRDTALYRGVSLPHKLPGTLGRARLNTPRMVGSSLGSQDTRHPVEANPGTHHTACTRVPWLTPPPR